MLLWRGSPTSSSWESISLTTWPSSSTTQQWPEKPRGLSPPPLEDQKGRSSHSSPRHLPHQKHSSTQHHFQVWELQGQWTTAAQQDSENRQQNNCCPSALLMEIYKQHCIHRATVIIKDSSICWKSTRMLDSFFSQAVRLVNGVHPLPTCTLISNKTHKADSQSPGKDNCLKKHFTTGTYAFPPSPNCC